MTAYTAVSLGVAGTLSNPQAVTVSDTINGNDIAAGCILEVKNGSGSTITVTLVDPGRTGAGNATVSPQTVGVTTIAAGATRRIKPSAAFIDSSSNAVTVTYSSATSVTYELYT